MIYFISRETDLMFEGAEDATVIDGVLYDVIRAPSDVGLDRISDHVVDDSSWTFRKTNPRMQAQVREYVDNRYHLMNELLFD